MTARDHDPSEASSRGPDLTEPVMRRLGLSGITPRDAKRRRRRRAMLRAALCVVVAGAGGLVVMLPSSQPQPSTPSIPTAIRHDLQRHGRTIDRTVRSIQGLGRQLPTLAVPAPQPGEGPGAEAGETAAKPSV